jgi:putative intracellular protease/amidase
MESQAGRLFAEAGAPAALYPVADALAAAGGRVEHGPDYEPFVVVDRELITGQNPRSDHALAAALVAALEAGRVG